MICNVHNVLYRLWKLVYVATYSQLQDVSHLNIHLWPLMVIRLFVLASLSTWAVTLGQLVIKCAWVRFYSGLTTRTRVHSMQALKCVRVREHCFVLLYVFARVWNQFSTPLPSDSLVEETEHLVLSRPTSHGNKRAHTHKCTHTCMQTNTVPCLIRQVVINTWGVLVRPRLCHRGFMELQF